MPPLDDIKNDLTLAVGRTRAILRGLKLLQREETVTACLSDDLAYLIELAALHVASADALTERLDEAVTHIRRQEG